MRDVVFESVPTNTVWIFRKDGSVGSADFPTNAGKVPELQSPETVYIFDSMSGSTHEICHCAAKRIMFASYGSTYKQAGRELTKLGFTTPSKQEMERASEVLGRGRGSEKAVDVEWYFNHSGGALRPAFNLSPQDTKNSLVACSKLVKLDNILSIVGDDIPVSVCAAIAARTSLFSTVVATKHLKDLLDAVENEDYQSCEPKDHATLEALWDAYRVDNMQWQICSEFVFELLRENAGDKAQQFQAQT